MGRGRWAAGSPRRGPGGRPRSGKVPAAAPPGAAGLLGAAPGDAARLVALLCLLPPLSLPLGGLCVGF